MPIRISNQMIYSTAQNQIRRSTANLFKAQEQAATQQKINRMSDDAVAAAQLLSVKETLRLSEQFQRNIDSARGLTAKYDATLDGVIGLVSRAKELMLSQASDISASQQTRDATRVEIAGLLQGLLDSANERHGSRYIFAGYRDTQAPFLNHSTLTTAGAGNAGLAAVAAESVFDPIQWTGDSYRIRFTGPATYDIFNVTQGVFESTGNAYSSGAAIRFNGISVTIVDAGGPPAAGDVFDVAAANAGAYVGDSGAVRIELEPNKQTLINMTGDNVFQGVGAPNSVDLFDIFNRAVAALRTNDTAAIQTLIDEFDKGLSQITHFQAIAGSRENLLADVEERNATLRQSLQNRRSELQDIDMADALTKLTQQETALEATLSTAARVITPSLLDFLR